MVLVSVVATLFPYVHYPAELTGWINTPHLYNRVLTWLMMDQMSVQVSRDEK